MISSEYANLRRIRDKIELYIRVHEVKHLCWEGGNKEGDRAFLIAQPLLLTKILSPTRHILYVLAASFQGFLMTSKRKYRRAAPPSLKNIGKSIAKFERYGIECLHACKCGSGTAKFHFRFARPTPVKILTLKDNIKNYSNFIIFKKKEILNTLCLEQRLDTLSRQLSRNLLKSLRVDPRARTSLKLLESILF